MRRGLQRGVGRFDLGQLSRGGIGPGIVEDPMGDGIKITRDMMVEANAIVHALRATPIVRRAAAKASS